MNSIIEKLKKLTNGFGGQGWVGDNCQYLTIMGSVAYGVSSDTSDMDVYGFCIPPKNIIFPHLAGEIEGFGRQKKRFEQYQQHHIVDPSDLAGKGRTYDLTIYNIVKYFNLCMENNPNMIDSLWTPQECVLHITKVGQMVRDNRKLFLHKGSWHKFRGYAYSQLHKMSGKSPEAGSKRQKLREEYGFDVKFAYHVVRLLDEVEQILAGGDIDLRRNKEQLKSIRRGEMSEQEIRAWASAKESQLDELYHKSKLQYSPDEQKIKKILLECLEEHYGNLESCIVQPDAAVQALKEVFEVLERNRRLLE